MAFTLKLKLLNKAFKVLHHMDLAYFFHSLSYCSYMYFLYQLYKTPKQVKLFSTSVFICQLFLFCNTLLSCSQNLLSVILQEVAQILLPLKSFHQFPSQFKAELGVIPYHTLSLVLHH